MATYTWTTGTSGAWTTAANWTPAEVPNNATADVVIDAAPAGNTAYTVSIGAGESITVNTLSLNAVTNLEGTNVDPYDAAILAMENGSTLAFAAGSAGTIEGPLQSVITMDNATIVNAGIVNAFIQGSGDVRFTGTNAINFTNWVQSLGTVTIDTTQFAELDGNTLWDGIFEPQGDGAVFNFGGAGGGLIVNIETMTGPPLIPTGWTELIYNGANTEINQWNGTAYVPVEQTLRSISNRATLEVLGGRDFTSPNTFSLGDGGEIILAAGTFTTAGLTIASGGDIKGSATIAGDIVNNGVIAASSPGLVITGAITGTGTLTFADTGGTMTVGSVSQGETVVMTEGNNTLRLSNPGAFQGTIVANVGDNIELLGVTATTAVLTNGTLVVSDGTQTVASLNLAGDYTGDSFSVVMSGGTAQITVTDGPPVCYVRGTLILTTKGEVAVEDLQVGDLVVTASGSTAPIVWLGRRRVNCARHPEPRKVWPVRIRAGAFGPELPARDLVVSPQHAVYAEGVLVPIRILANGLNVTQEAVETVEYYHVELERHDLLIAEGLASESYLENGDRNMFENGDGTMQLHPDFSAWTWDARACAELRVVGPEVDAIRATLRAHAGQQDRPAARAA
ncbi:MAG: Hint domain-containing protein [Acetobacteraceae bacterium]